MTELKTSRTEAVQDDFAAEEVRLPAADGAVLNRGEGWKIYRLRLPERVSDVQETDVKSMIAVFNEQFGHQRVSLSESPLAHDEAGVAAVHERNGVLHPVLQREGIQAARAVQVRLMAHEIEHTRHMDHEIPPISSDYYQQLFARLPGHLEFAELQTRIEKRFDQLVERPGDAPLQVQSLEHYLDPHEVFARLRAYQIYLQQGEQAGEPQPHEFIEVLRPDDLRWLDSGYSWMECEGLREFDAAPSDLRRRPRAG